MLNPAPVSTYPHCLLRLESHLACCWLLPPWKEIHLPVPVPWSVDHIELERLKGEIPTSEPHVGILNALEPLEQGMIWTESKGVSQLVVPECEDHPLDGQTFLLSGAVSHTESLWLMYSTRCSFPSTIREKMAPSPLSDASVCKIKGREKSEECNSGQKVRKALLIIWGLQNIKQFPICQIVHCK